MRAGKFLATALLLLALSTAGWAASGSENFIPPRTVITTQNWQQYKQFMTDGMQALFQGQGKWRFPDAFQMVIEPTRHYELPPTYVQQTEKYAGQVKIINLPDGRHTIDGYVGGIPFPNPQEPLKGWKVLVDDWYAYAPYVLCADTCGFTFEDRFGNITHNQFFFVQHLFSHRGDADITIDDPNVPGVYYTEIIEVEQPEQARYTAVLTLYYADMTKSEDTYIFVPALRRSLRLSTAARCTPFIGSDLILDDPRVNGFNGGFSRFDADIVGEQKILGDIIENTGISDDFNNYYQPVFFAKPVIGKFEVRDTTIIDVRRIPSQRKGYCYGKRLMWIDKELMMSFWQDIYDESGKFWKMNVWPVVATPVPGQGPAITPNGWANQWDIQNNHLSFWAFKNGDLTTGANADCRNRDGENMDDVGKYSTVSGLAQVMR